MTSVLLPGGALYGKKEEYLADHPDANSRSIAHGRNELLDAEDQDLILFESRTGYGGIDNYCREGPREHRTAFSLCNAYDSTVGDV